ncbi:MAG: peptidyl-alpha-hydroxyglycine alpha-amidating lyase family protein [Candidatus Solibacter sp.]
MRRHFARMAGTLVLAGSLGAQIAYDAAPDPARMPDRVHLGEVAGVATNSKGSLLVYTRTGGGNATWGASRILTHGGSRLFEFDRTGKFVREIGEGVYGFLFAQAVRVDAQDNIWVVDRGSNMVIKFTPDGRLAMAMGRKPEAVNAPAGGAPGGGRGQEAPAGGRGQEAAAGGRGGGGGGRGPNAGAGVPGDNFNRPTDVAFDAAGNIYISDGMGNARIAKFDKDGAYLKSWGTRGNGPGQFDMPMSLALDAKGNVYVADRGNKRIQVFDSEGTFQRQIANAGAPWAICISPGSHQFLYSSNSNDPNSMEGGEIYRLELDGTVLGKFGSAGKLAKEFGTVNAMDCRNPNELTVGEVGNWRVQRVRLKP